VARRLNGSRVLLLNCLLLQEFVLHASCCRSLCSTPPHVRLSTRRRVPLLPARLPQEFVLNTPSNEASKFWIGGAAHTAKISAIFAQVGRAGPVGWCGQAGGREEGRVGGRGARSWERWVMHGSAIQEGKPEDMPACQQPVPFAPSSSHPPNLQALATLPRCPPMPACCS